MKLIGYFKNFILLIGFFIVLNSCKTTKPSCDAYGYVNHDNNTLNSDILIQYDQHQD